MLLCLFGPGSLALDARVRKIPDLVTSLVPAVSDNTALIARVTLAARALIAFPFLADVVKKSVCMGPTARTARKIRHAWRRNLHRDADRACVRIGRSGRIPHTAGSAHTARMDIGPWTRSPQSGL